LKNSKSNEVNIMLEKILVAYASRTGSTAGVAQAIGQVLVNGGLQVDVLPMQEVTDLAPYQAVVVGSAVQGGKWLPEAMKFIQTHHAALSCMPCAVFMVCMTLAMGDGKYRQQVAAWLEPVRQMVHPVSEGLFAGVLDISKVPSFSDRLKFRLSVLMGVWSEGDHRDWEAIRSWASGLQF
jgi:menaquinone-dependent protoporphyrinogen oxidase